MQVSPDTASLEAQDYSSALHSSHQNLFLNDSPSAIFASSRQLLHQHEGLSSFLLSYLLITTDAL